MFFERVRIERDVGDVIDSFEGTRAWIDLEQTLMQELDLDISQDSDDDDRNHYANASPCHERSTTAIFSGGEVVDDLVGPTRTAEELVSEENSAKNESAGTDGFNLEAIQSVLNNDVDEIVSENVVSASVAKDDEGEDAHSIEDNEGDGNDANAHDVITPGAHSFDYCTNVKSAAVPLRATSITPELRNRDALLRRQGLVDDIISKLRDSSFINALDDCDESQNVVLLRGDGGIGKSVLCSMVVSNRSTLLHFADGIAWLSVSQVRGEGAGGGMTYDLYVEYLESICKQLDLVVPSFDEPIALALDSSSVLRRKEEAAMEAAKAEMCRVLSNMHVLIVLDDVWSRSAIPWLNFSNRLDSHLRVLVSTRLRGGFRKATVFDIGELSQQEARTLLLRESGCEHAALTIEEESLAVDIVNRCSLPIAICIAGRRLSSSSNRYEAFQELANEMSGALALHINSHDAMFDLTDRCFVGINGESLKASFVAFSAIFTTNEGKRNFVSATAASKVLDAILLPEDITDLACVNGTVFILQRLQIWAYSSEKMICLQSTIIRFKSTRSK
eukprot:scaffold32_cov144-Skeletonema_menzelii.AAC.8